MQPSWRAPRAAQAVDAASGGSCERTHARAANYVTSDGAPGRDRGARFWCGARAARTRLVRRRHVSTRHRLLPVVATAYFAGTCDSALFLHGTACQV
jgi:hypothetical protein